MHRLRTTTALVLTAALAAPAHAAETRVELTPGPSSVAIRAYKLGMFALDGQFTRFQGVLTYDPENHADCRVRLRVDVASLTMSSPLMQERTLGPEFLDAARYPTLAFNGACDAARLNGALALHGVTHPFGLALDWRPASVAAVGRLRRADWGMTALPVLVGATVRIKVTAHLAAPQHAGP